MYGYDGYVSKIQEVDPEGSVITPQVDDMFKKGFGIIGISSAFCNQGQFTVTMRRDVYF